MQEMPLRKNFKEGCPKWLPLELSAKKMLSLLLHYRIGYSVANKSLNQDARK